MIIARLVQIRVDDKVAVWKFYKDAEEIGSRGVTLTDKDIDIVLSLTLAEFYNLKTEGIAIEEEPETEIGKIAKKAYDEYLKAVELVEKAKAQVIE